MQMHACLNSIQHFFKVLFRHWRSVLLAIITYNRRDLALICYMLLSLYLSLYHYIFHYIIICFKPLGTLII